MFYFIFLKGKKKVSYQRLLSILLTWINFFFFFLFSFFWYSNKQALQHMDYVRTILVSCNIGSLKE